MTICHDIPKDTLKPTDKTNKTLFRNINVVPQNKFDHYENNKTETWYQQATINFKSNRGNFSQPKLKWVKWHKTKLKKYILKYSLSEVHLKYIQCQAVKTTIKIS